MQRSGSCSRIHAALPWDLSPLKYILTLMSYGCKRERIFFFFFGLRVHICSFEILLHFHSSCWWVSADLYYHVIMGSRDCVSLKVMACDCLLHYFQWDSVIAILRDSIPLKVIVWDCPYCYWALNWIEFILNSRGQPQSLTFKRCGLDKVFGQLLESLTACMENIFLLFKTFIS